MKRIKKVFSSAAAVTAAFAAQTQDYGRVSSGNIYFESDVIYSYGSHFPMCKIYGKVALLTTRTYSSSTGKHISAVWCALRDAGYTILLVDNVIATELDEHGANAQVINAEVTEYRGKANRARKYTEMWNNRADEREAAGIEYQDWVMTQVVKSFQKAA